MTNYRVASSVRPRVYVQGAKPARGLDGTRAVPPTWQNQFWKDTPAWARPIFESLSQFLARPTFWNGILVGDGVGPQRDPDTGVWTFPSAPLPIDANGVGGDQDAADASSGGGSSSSPLLNGGTPAVTNRTTIYNWSMQSDNYDNRAAPWPGWRLDRAGWAHFDRLAVNTVYSRGPVLHFQFNGSSPTAYDRSSVSISQEGQLSAPVVITAHVLNSELGGPVETLVLNADVDVHAGGWLNALRLTVGGVDVSLEGHLHDDRYSLLGHTHTGSATYTSVTTPTIDHGSGGNVAVTSGLTTPILQHPSGTGTAIAAGKINATALEVGGVAVSLSTHSHSAPAHSALSGLSGDDHTQYANNSRGDARWAQLVHSHTLAASGVARGYKNAITDGSGRITVTHGMASQPTSVVCVSTANNSSGSDSGVGTPSIGGAGINLVVHNIDATSFEVWVHDSTVGGAAIGSLNVAFYWLAAI